MENGTQRQLGLESSCELAAVFGKHRSQLGPEGQTARYCCKQGAASRELQQLQQLQLVGTSLLVGEIVKNRLLQEAW